MNRFINKVVEGHDLTSHEATEAMKLIMSGGATDAQIGSFITALRMKGETVDEVSACAGVMREFAEKINPNVDGPLVDTCGTGGDKIKTFNISTISAFVIAGAGLSIAKHGNRSVTSKAGSADLLEALGVKIDMPSHDVEKAVEEVGIGFMFAPAFHGAMKYAIGPRKEIGIRTIFNILGPLTNPASAQAQVLGVYDADLTDLMAGVLGKLGTERALVVHGVGGLDEISTFGDTKVSELKEGSVNTYTIKPEDFGIKRASTEELAGGDPRQNADIAIRLLKDKETGPMRDIVLLNSAAGIYVGGMADSIADAVPLAAESIDSGAAYEKLSGLINFSR